MKHLFLLLAASFFTVTAQADNFDPATNILRMDSVVVGDQKYFDVSVRIDQFQVLAVGSSAPNNGGGVKETCEAADFTISKYNNIVVGMSLDQVNQTIGCKPGSPVRTSGFVNYSWSTTVGGVRIIDVIFDDPSLTVTGALGGSFKRSGGF